jgi:hypothetical protein
LEKEEKMISHCSYCKRKVKGVKGKFSIAAFILIPLIFSPILLFVFQSLNGVVLAALIYPLYHGLMKPRIYCPICGISLFRKDKEMKKEKK